MRCHQDFNQTGLSTHPQTLILNNTSDFQFQFCLCFQLFIQTYFLPVIGLVDPKDLSPGDLVVCCMIHDACVCVCVYVHMCVCVLSIFPLQGVNKDSYLILDKLPSEYVPVLLPLVYVYLHLLLSSRVFLVELGVFLPPCSFDSRVKAMELDERPTEQYSDIGGLDKQIEEVKPHQFMCTV